MHLSLNLNNLIKEKKYSEIIRSIQKIPKNNINSSILNLLGTARLLNVKKNNQIKENYKEFSLALENFRAAFLKEKKTISAIKGLENFINTSIFLFEKTTLKSKNNKSEEFLKDALFYFEKNKHFLEQNLSLIKTVIKLYKKFSNAKKVKFYCELLINNNIKDIKIFSTYLLYNSYFKNWTQKDYFKESININNFLEKFPESKLEPLSKNDNKKIRIGFFSADLNRNHSVLHFVKTIFKNYDKKSFEVYVYFNHKKTEEGDVVKKVKNLIDKFVHVFELSDLEVINLIRSDKLDIFIDLMGITSKTRLQLIKNRVSQIQISWCGYCNTSGIKEMDYLISDKNLIYENEEKLYHEKILYMPNIWNCHERIDFKKKLKKEPKIKKNFIVFGSFNNFNKINEEVIFVWSNILKNCNNSKLILKSSSRIIPENIIKKFDTHGVKDQIDIINWNIDYKKHLETYDKIDIALDTFPYNGVTTTFEALWMGVPVITLKGENFNSRCGNSILKNIDLVDLIATDIKEYISTAVSLAKDQEYQLKLRNKIYNNLAKGHLFNEERFSFNFYEILKNLINYK